MTIATQIDANSRKLAQLEGRLQSLEISFNRVTQDDQGNKHVLKGEPGSIEDATAAAAKVMAAELKNQHQALAEAVAESKKQQNDFQLDILNAIEQFRATAQTWLEQTVRQSVKELLVAANIIDEKGNRHPSMKGEKGEPSFVPGPASIGPVGPQGLPGHDGMSKQEIEAAMQNALDTFEATAYADLSAKARQDVRNYVVANKARWTDAYNFVVNAYNSIKGFEKRLAALENNVRS